MSLTPNPRIYLRQSVQPNEYPVPGVNLAYDDTATIDIDAVSASLAPGSFLIKVEAVSLDPYMRARMRPEFVASYSPAFKVGETIRGHIVGKILKSASEKYKEGSVVVAFDLYQHYNVLTEATMGLNPVPSLNLPSTTFIGVLGMPGLTAWSGWKEYARAKAGETLFVTTGAGAVGSLVIQLAKLDGLKVIASAGSDEKVEYCKSLGADVAFNYKTTTAEEALKDFGKIDIYWDNVGGEQADAAFGNMNAAGRVIVCGLASSYSTEPVPMKNYSSILINRLSVHGFIVPEICEPHIESFYKTMPAKVISGDIKFKENIYQGFENAPKAFDDLLRGRNTGKVVIAA